MNDYIKNSTPGSGAAGNYRGHLRSIATGDHPEEPEIADVAPDSMGGLDAAAMLLVDDTPCTGIAPQADDALHPDEQPPAMTSTPEPEEEQQCADELDGYELLYAAGSTNPMQSPKRSFLRRRSPAQPHDGDELAEAVAASEVDVWAAHHDEAWTETTDQPSTTPATPDQDEDHRARRPLPLLALAAALAVCLAVGVAVVFGGGGCAAKAPHTAKDHVSIQSATDKTRARHKVTRQATTTGSTGPGQTARKHHKNKHAAAAVRKTNTTSAVSTRPAIVATTPTNATPAVSSAPPPTEGTSTRSNKTSTTTHSGSSSKSSAGSNTASAGALPDVKQTEQQP
jgi:organic hydroperoxide reductase OsmC/OhrA